MWQFIHGSDEMFEGLERRAQRACVRFADQLMPCGADPDRATIGFEVDPLSGEWWLLVDRTVDYYGSSSAVGRWLADGCMYFADVDRLRYWLGTTLRDAYRTPTPPTGAKRRTTDKDIYSSNEAERDLDDVGVKGLRIAMRLGCGMKDLPS